MSNAKAGKKTKAKRSGSMTSERSIARRIKGIDRKMQAALEKGDFTVAMQLAEEQGRLLELLMLHKDGE